MYQELLDTLSQGEPLKGLAKAVEFETNTYNQNGLITYITHEYLIDIMTDTTERQPTFTLHHLESLLIKPVLSVGLM